MAVKDYQIVFCVLLLLRTSFICKGSMVTYHPQNLTWFESMKTCQLATKDDIGDIDDQIKGWAGGIYRMTKWMYHEGCYFNRRGVSGYERQKQFPDNSPSRCSIYCNDFLYFGLKNHTCVCMQVRDVDTSQLQSKSLDCKLPCPGSSLSDSTCGSGNKNYADLYKHVKGFTVRNSNDYSVKCVSVRLSRQGSSLVLEGVNCSKSLYALCLDPKRPYSSFPLSNQRLEYKDAKHNCRLYAGETAINVSRGTFWTGIERHEVLEWITPLKYYRRSRRCLTIENNREHPTPCTTTQPFFCSEGIHETTSDNSVLKDFTVISNYDTTTEVPNTSSVLIETVKAVKNTTGTLYQTFAPSVKRTTESEDHTFVPSVKRTTETEDHIFVSSVNTTIDNTANSTSDTQTDIPPTDIFAIQIGVAVSVCILVILLAVLARLVGRVNRCQNIFPKSTSDDNNLIADQKDKNLNKRSSYRIADNYSLAWDAKTSQRGNNALCHDTDDNVGANHHTTMENEEEGESEYNHLDFTIRSTKDVEYTDTNDSSARSHVNSVFDQPWDGHQSTVHKLFSQIGHSIRKSSIDIRNSFLKRQSSRMVRNTDDNKQYCEYELQQQNLLYDSPKLDQNEQKLSSTSGHVRDKTMKQTEMLFPVLPISERLEVQSTHIYAEPEDRRTSFGERIIQIISYTNFKLPWGIDLRSNRPTSRAKSRIYSFAKTIEETDESEV